MFINSKFIASAPGSFQPIILSPEYLWFRSKCCLLVKSSTNKIVAFNPKHSSQLNFFSFEEKKQTKDLKEGSHVEYYIIY